MSDRLEELPKSPAGHRVGLVTFLDVLGFRELTRKSIKENVVEVLDELTAAREWSHYAQYGFNAQRDVVQFQDSIVRCTETGCFVPPLGETKLPIIAAFCTSLGDELSSLRDMQIGLIEKDILIRGAIAYGEFDVVKGVVYGEAYERAAFLEHSAAVFPRIILDEKILENSPGITSIGQMVFDQHVSKDDDGVCFIDYLEALAREIPWEIDTFLQMLEQHTLALDRAIKKGGYDERARAKIDWLCSYHNNTLVKCSRHLTRAHQVDWHSFKVDPDIGWVDINAHLP